MKLLKFKDLERYRNSDLQLLIEAAIQASMGNMRLYFNAETVYAQLYSGKVLRRDKRKEVIASIELIDWVHKVDCNLYYADPDEVFNLPYDPPFTMISANEFCEIIQKKLHKEFLHYLFLVSTFSKSIELNGKYYTVGYMHGVFFAQLEGVDVQTIYRYNKNLEDAHMMAFVHSKFNAKECKAGEIHYARYENAQWLYTKYPDHRSAATANFRRSVSYRYTKFLKHPEQFTPEKIAQLREDVVRYNDQCAQLAQAGYTNAQPKDLSVFT